jgi:hypothetical protein
MGEPTSCVQGTFLPTIGLVFIFSQQQATPSWSYESKMSSIPLGCPLSMFRNPKPHSTPTKIPIHQLSISPQPTQPNEWDPPSLPHSPSSLSTSLQGSSEWLARKSHS